MPVSSELLELEAGGKILRFSVVGVGEGNLSKVTKCDGLKTAIKESLKNPYKWVSLRKYVRDCQFNQSQCPVEIKVSPTADRGTLWFECPK